MRAFAVWLALPLLLAGALAGAAPKPKGEFLFVWAKDADGQSSDFLAIVDIGRRSPNRGKVIATLPVGQAETNAHHTEHEMASDGVLFANGWGAGRTWVFELSDPWRPAIRARFDGDGTLSHAHSFARLANGNRLVTFQQTGHGNRAPGGLAEVTPQGAIVRSAPAAVADPREFIRPYSLAPLPKIDRVVSTTADMHATGVARSVQIWRLSNLALLHTIPLPPGPRGAEGHDSAEPRVLADGRTVLVSTFKCGLYRLDGLDGPAPSAKLVYDFGDGTCALPVIAGRYWVMTNNALPGLYVVDIADPERPRGVGELKLPDGWSPHWISLAPDRRRIVMTGHKGMENKVLLISIDPKHGKLRLIDEIDFNRRDWPHGASGPAIPHGTVFSR